MKTKIALLIGLFGFFMAALTSCYNSDREKEATLIINLGATRIQAALETWPPSNADLSKLEYEIKLSGPIEITEKVNGGSGPIILFVTPGYYTIAVTAYSDGELYARGITDATVRSGQNNVPITMHRAGIYEIQVVVLPDEKYIQKGDSFTFGAKSFYGPSSIEVPDEYKWSLSGNTLPETKIDDATGELFVDSSESADALTVTAESKTYSSKYGTANVILINPNIPLIHAKEPFISSQPQDATYTINGAAIALTVTADVDDGGTLSYQWYKNTTNSISNGTPLGAANGAQTKDYTPGTSELGTLYYYVVVTNTNNSVNGNKTVAIVSGVVAVTVNALVNALAPIIDTQPQNANFTLGTSATLTVAVSVTDDGILSYQWYSNTSNSNTSGSLIRGETGANYNPPNDSSGIFYYYVVVTNTISDNGDGGLKSATTASNPATITINKISEPITFTSSTLIKTYGEAAFTNTLNSYNGSGTISYSSSNTTVATVNSSGQVTILNVGTTIITAVKTEDAAYSEATTAYTLVVNPKNITLTIGATGHTLIPIDSTDVAYRKSTTFDVSVSSGGIVGSDTITVNVEANSYGLAVTNNTGINNTAKAITLTYDGAAEVSQTTAVSVGLVSGSDNYTLTGTNNVSVTIIDGQAAIRPIPITQNNLAAFNTYATNTATATDALVRHYELKESITLSGTWTPIGSGTGANSFTGTFDGKGKTINLGNDVVGITGTYTFYSGLFGYIGTGAEVKNLRLTGSITINNTSSDTYVGPIAGYSYDGIIRNVSSSVDVTIDIDVSNTTMNAGGIVGRTSNNIIKNCYSTGDISASNLDNTYSITTSTSGGISGHLEGNGNVGYCWASGYISTTGNFNQYAGGIVYFYNNTGFFVSLSNCVALNPKITGNAIGRITQQPSVGTDNYARSDMLLNTSTTSSIDPTSDSGADISSTDYEDDSWWKTTPGWGIFWDGNNEDQPWKWDSTAKRPILWFETGVNE